MDLTLNFLEKWKNPVKNKTKIPKTTNNTKTKNREKNSKPTPPERGNRIM